MKVKEYTITITTAEGGKITVQGHDPKALPKKALELVKEFGLINPTFSQVLEVPITAAPAAQTTTA